MIVERINDYRKGRIKQWPVNANRASQLGHECLRFLVFERTRWQEKILHDVRLQAIFDEGNIHESAVLRLLQDAGFQIVEQQRAFSWKEYSITGHIDAKILTNGYAMPIEIKSASPYSFQSINSPDDLYKGRYHYQRMYPAQMTLYLLMDEKERGMFLFKNKVTGEIKEILMYLDYELGEQLLQKAEAINAHVADKTIPDCMPFDEDICGSCGYLHICMPEIKRDALEIADDPEIVTKIDRWNELKPCKSEYDRLDKQLKNAFKEKEKVLIGDYLILGKWIERRGYTVEPSKYWQTKIQTLQPKGGEDE